jgi:hypothetical protein
MVDPAFLDVKQWRIADAALVLCKFKKELPGLPRGIWIVDSGIAPVDLYTYLVARFGSANGFSMRLKSPTSDNLVHWHWTLQYLDRIIEVMGHTMYAQFVVEGTDDPETDEVKALVDAIKCDFSAHGPAMSEAKRKFQRWTVFVNPYCRMRRVAEGFRERLLELDVGGLKLPTTPRRSSEMPAFNEEFAAAIKVYTEALGICTSLRMLAPVLAESFINLVLFVTVNPSTRADTRLYDSIFRQDVDVRVRSLHLHCRGFTGPVDTGDKRFKSFQSLMQHRNDFLHGNFDPAKLAYATVYFDDMIPLPKKYENMSELALVNSLKHVEPPTALADLTAVDEFIDLTLEATHEKVRAALRQFMMTLDPGWLEAGQRPGVLFPENPTFVVLGDREQPNE